MFNHSMGWLLSLVRRPDEELPGKDAQNFAYEAFVGFAPNGPGEIMLVQQAIAAYEMAMWTMHRLKRSDNLAQMQEFGNMGIKMMGIYERLFQTLMKSRKPQQVVEVQHTHRHVHLNGQVPQGAGVVTQIEGQPYEATDPRALALAPGPAMLGEDPARDALPVPADKARPMPAARRRVRHRRAQGPA
jgi:hypothetical protein